MGPNGFLQEFELLGESLGGSGVGDPSDVSAWAGETRDETLTNRIAARGGHDNRNCRCRDLRCLHRNRPSDQDHGDLCLYQLGSHGAQVREILCEPMLKFEISALKNAFLTKAVLERPPSLCVQNGMRTGVQDTDALQPAGLLRGRGERPVGGREGETRDNRPPPHSTTSSANRREATPGTTRSHARPRFCRCASWMKAPVGERR